MDELDYQVRWHEKGFLSKLLDHSVDLVSSSGVIGLASAKLDPLPDFNSRYVVVSGFTLGNEGPRDLQSSRFNVKERQDWFRGYVVFDPEDASNKVCDVRPMRGLLAPSPAPYPVFFVTDSEIYASDRETLLAEMHDSWRDSELEVAMVGAFRVHSNVPGDLLAAVVLTGLIETLRRQYNKGVVTSPL